MALTYDSRGRVIRKTYADGTHFDYAFGPRDWPTNRIDAMGRLTKYEYDNAGELTRVDYPRDLDVVLSYDILGRMTSRVDAAGTWSWTYDGESPRVLSETRHAVLDTQTVSYTYAPDTFDLASVSVGACTTAYSWAAGRLTNVVSASSAVSARNFSYSYVPNSDLIAQVSSFQFQVSKTYDALNRLVSISNFAGETAISSFTYDYDATSRRTKRADLDASWIDYGHDAYDQVTSAFKTNSPSGLAVALYRHAYAYDQAGGRTHEQRGQQELCGTLNSLNQLTHRVYGGKLDVYGTTSATNVKVNGEGVQIFSEDGETNFLGGARFRAGTNVLNIVAYDSSGNRTEILRRVTAPPTNPQLFQYDPNGNLTNDGHRVFTWDDENRLVAIESTTNVPPADRRKSEYLYDAQWRRIGATDSVWNPTSFEFQVSSIRSFTYDGWLLLCEQSAAASGEGGNLSTNYYTWGLDVAGTLQAAGGIGGLLCASFGGTTSVSSVFYAFDANGNVTDLVDTNGGVVAHYEYDPFGRTVAQSGPSANLNPFRFSSKYFEPAWDLYYYGYRHYGPDRGCWASRDPIGLMPLVTTTDSDFQDMQYGRLYNTSRSRWSRARPSGDDLTDDSASEDVLLRSLLHPYVFVENTPCDCVDPTGLIAQGCCGQDFWDCMGKCYERLDPLNYLDELAKRTVFAVTTTYGWPIWKTRAIKILGHGFKMQGKKAWPITSPGRILSIHYNMGARSAISRFGAASSGTLLLYGSYMAGVGAGCAYSCQMDNCAYQ